jgi:deoxyhypusine synthase
MPRQANLLRRVQPVEVRMGSRVSNPLPEMGQTAFQGKNLSLAVRVWVVMLKQDLTLLLSLAGALIPAAIRHLLVYRMENFLIDCLFSTGPYRFHGPHEPWGKISEPAEKGNLHCDSTIGFSPVVTAVAQRNADFLRQRLRPDMKKMWSRPPKENFP